jgi:Spy/CpxP family protein refolding chaperone
MRTLIAVVTVAVVLWMPGKICAQGEAGGRAERIQDLKLTDEQEAKIADILKEHGPRIREAAKELVTVAKDEVDKVRGVLTPAQKTKLETLKEERQERRAAGLAERLAHLGDLDMTDAEVARIAEIRKEFRPRIGKALEGLQGLLSAEQMKAREQGLKAGKKRSEVLASLNLTDEQKGKVEAVGQEIGALVRQELEQIRGVLSEGQKEKIAELKGELREHVRDRMAHRIANLRDLNLTDEQKAQIAEIRREYRPRVQEAGNRLREAVRQEVEMVLGVLKA